MFWNYIPFGKAKEDKSQSCDACNLYHTKKFASFRCACDCHAEKSEAKPAASASTGLDWDASEEITQPGFGPV